MYRSQYTDRPKPTGGFTNQFVNTSHVRISDSEHDPELPPILDDQSPQSTRAFGGHLQANSGGYKQVVRIAEECNEIAHILSKDSNISNDEYHTDPGDDDDSSSEEEDTLLEEDELVPYSKPIYKPKDTQIPGVETQAAQILSNFSSTQGQYFILVELFLRFLIHMLIVMVKFSTSSQALCRSSTTHQ